MKTGIGIFDNYRKEIFIGVFLPIFIVISSFGIYYFAPQKNIESVFAAGDDFKIQRGYVDISTGEYTKAISAGTHYTAPADTSRAFIRIVGTRLSGNGHTGATTESQGPWDFMATVQNPENLLSSVNFVRVHDGEDPNFKTRVYWEIIEYIGAPGGANEFVVRDVGNLSVTPTNLTVDGMAVPEIVDDNDIVVFITGQKACCSSSGSIRSAIFTAEWLSGTDVPRFTHGWPTNSSSYVSYVVVEFIGSNWKIQRAEHTYTLPGVWETENITAVNSVSRTFTHVQFRSNTGHPNNGGQQVYLSDVSTLSFKMRDTAGELSAKHGVVWIVENIQTNGVPMNVQRISGIKASSGTEPQSWTETITAISSTSTASIMGETGDSAGTSVYGPRGAIGFQITDLTTVTLWRSDSGKDNDYRFEVVEWPTEALSAPTVTTSDADSVATSSAVLNGSANPNGDSTTGWFRYSTSDPGDCSVNFGTRVPISGGTSLGSGNTSVAYTETPTGLVNDTTYYYCAIASNSIGSATGTIVSFKTTLDGWYDSAWGYRKKITIDSTKIPSTQTNFPILINSTDDDLRYTADGGNVEQTDGGDILFTDINNIKLDHEIERYTRASGEVVAWVEIPILSGSEDTEIYMYYGNSGGDNQWNIHGGTWDDNFIAVHHLEEAQTGNDKILDSTSNKNDSTFVRVNGGGADPDADGVVNGANQFDGSYSPDSDYIELVDNGSLDITGALTVSAWVYAETGPGLQGRTVLSHYCFCGGDSSHRGWNFGAVWKDTSFRFRVYDSSGDQGLGMATLGGYFDDPGGELGGWHYMTGTYIPSTNVLLYQDGVQVASDTGDSVPSIIAYSNDSVTIARRSSGGQSEFDGIIDEVRISNVARSADWILTEYNNMIAPGNFYVISEEETTPIDSSLSGHIISSTYDTGIADGVGYNSIMWLGSAGVGGTNTVKFQIATAPCDNGSDGAPNCNNQTGWGGNKTDGDGAFIGADGTSSTYYGPVAPGTPIAIPFNHHIGKQFIRYLIQVDRDASSTSPVIQDVILNISR